MWSIFNRLSLPFLIRFSLLYFFLRNALAVDGAPGKNDVGEHERDEEGDYRHGAERELAATAVGESERTLKVDVGWIVGGIVPAGYQQQNQHGKHGSDARKPDSLIKSLFKNRLSDSKENQYHSPYVLEYWANKHGVDIISKMWQQANATDQRDFIRTYQRITGTNQQKFNEEIYEAATRFITWDLEHIKTAYQQGANIHTCELDLYGDVYAIASTRCPQNYGYNGMKLKVPAAGTTVTINFEGVTSSNNGFVIQKPEKAEWRYGFLAVKTDDTRIYGEMNKVNASSKSGTATFTVPEGTKHLWLVVAATPTEYWHSEDNQWPYEFTLDGTEPDGDKCKVTRK